MGEPVPGPCQLVGFFGVDPPLRASEAEYLTAFAESRRWRRPGGPYAVPDNPAAECLDTAIELDDYRAPADGQPGLYCPWTPDRNGRALVPVSGPDTCTEAESIEWLAYLIEHFLAAEGVAATEPEFAGFGFDHVLDGVGTICGRSTGRIIHLWVRRNRLRVEVASLGRSDAA